MHAGNPNNRKVSDHGVWLIACLVLVWLLLPVLHTAGSHEIELGGGHCVVCQALAHASVLLVGVALVFLFSPAGMPFPAAPVRTLRRGARFARSERGPPCRPVR